MTLPDIYAGETKSLVLELSVPAAFAGDLPLGSLAVTYTPAALMAAATPMMTMAQQTGDQDLALRASELMQQARVMEQEAYDTMARKQMREQSFQTRHGRRP